MVRLKNPFMSLKATGKVGDITLRRSRKQNIAEKIPDLVDQKTPAQLSWRTMYQKAVELWHELSAAEKLAWESAATPRHMTGFAWFMSQALRPNPGIYLPLLGGTMQGEIKMDSNLLSGLIDPVANQEAATKKYHDDNLPAGGYTEGARAYHSVHQSIPRLVLTTLAFDSESYDTDSIHDNALNNSRLTCKTAGKYIIVLNLAWQPVAGGYRWAQFLLSATTIIAASSTLDVPGAGPATHLSTIYDLAVNDFIEVKLYHDSGGAVFARAWPDYSPIFEMQRIG